MRVRLVPLNSDDPEFGPYDVVQFDYTTSGREFAGRFADGHRVWVILPPTGIYRLFCETPEPAST